MPDQSFQLNKNACAFSFKLAQPASIPCYSILLAAKFLYGEFQSLSKTTTLNTQVAFLLFTS